MEESLNSINAMRNMEVIDINSGSKVGFIKDIKFDCEKHKIISLIMPGESKGWFSKNDDLEVPWCNIVKVGIDVILIKLDIGKEDIDY